MTFISFRQRGEPIGKATWFLNDQAEVKVSCPKCGGVGDLNEHRIDDDGRVSPSLQCECGFHGQISLVHWKAT